MSAYPATPWIVKSPKNDSRAFDVYDASGTTKLHHGFWGGERTARLIARAPELLVCLKAYVYAHESGHPPDPLAVKAAEAILLAAEPGIQP